MSENVGASTSCNLKGLHSLFRDHFTFTLLNVFAVVVVGKDI
jgi:hypothetical protein